MTGKEKEIYRRTKDWKEFRKQMISERKCCQMCGSKFKMNVHHKNPDEYTDLSPEKFLLLCNGCHKFMERKLTIKDKSKFHNSLYELMGWFTNTLQVADETEKT